ncbi:hypothetical protein EDB82DRAFT_80093 [Fusarium venenatum]|uniref:uncharacterized protein n=1 Tax=Fusarium venenatum TaxID=56646 RepID=UPI001D552F96|nr:hypothetical protein EDB82DRAFT_80093 [Fusarium venenatum]
MSSFHSFFKPFFPLCFYRRVPPSPHLLFLLSTLTLFFSSGRIPSRVIYILLFLFTICSQSLVIPAFHSPADPLVSVGSASHLCRCTTRALASTIIIPLLSLDVNGIKRLWPHNRSHRLCSCIILHYTALVLLNIWTSQKPFRPPTTALESRGRITITSEAVA